MKYEFRVKFWRDWGQDEEVVKSAFPTLNPLAGAVAQFCAELDENPVLKDNYTVENAAFAEHNEVHFTVLFTFEFNPDPFQSFRSCLQKTFNEGMAGEFNIDTKYLAGGAEATATMGSAISPIKKKPTKRS
jgi:hypothetical protein